MHPYYQINPFSIHMAKGFLHVYGQAYRTREGKRHGTDPPMDLVPVFDADPQLVGGGGSGG